MDKLSALFFEILKFTEVLQWILYKYIVFIWLQDHSIKDLVKVHYYEIRLCGFAFVNSIGLRVAFYNED